MSSLDSILLERRYICFFLPPYSRMVDLHTWLYISGNLVMLPVGRIRSQNLHSVFHRSTWKLLPKNNHKIFFFLQIELFVTKWAKICYNMTKVTSRNGLCIMNALLCLFFAINSIHIYFFHARPRYGLIFCDLSLSEGDISVSPRSRNPRKELNKKCIQICQR